MKIAYGDEVYGRPRRHGRGWSFWRPEPHARRADRDPGLRRRQEADINDALELAGFDPQRAVDLFDGRTGEPSTAR
jgi:hypothetical protein